MIQYKVNKYKRNYQGWTMDIQPQETKPISDDQELAKVLAGVTGDADSNLNFEDMPALTIPTSTDETSAPDPITTSPFSYSPPAIDSPVSKNIPTNNLDSIKKDALTELRPLVDKLELSPEEKFDIYLLLLRSTDDTTLIAPAHETAKTIADESKRAQALLDIIKEIDFLANPVQANL